MLLWSSVVFCTILFRVYSVFSHIDVANCFNFWTKFCHTFCSPILFHWIPSYIFVKLQAQISLYIHVHFKVCVYVHVVLMLWHHCGPFSRSHTTPLLSLYSDLYFDSPSANKHNLPDIVLKIHWHNIKVIVGQCSTHYRRYWITSL